MSVPTVASAPLLSSAAALMTGAVSHATSVGIRDARLASECKHGMASHATASSAGTGQDLSRLLDVYSCSRWRRSPRVDPPLVSLPVPCVRLPDARRAPLSRESVLLIKIPLVAPSKNEKRTRRMDIAGSTPALALIAGSVMCPLEHPVSPRSTDGFDGTDRMSGQRFLGVRDGLR
jgi:hypothetical protein